MTNKDFMVVFRHKNGQKEGKMIKKTLKIDRFFVI
jgi:hypothetical protein